MRILSEIQASQFFEKERIATYDCSSPSVSFCAIYREFIIYQNENLRFKSKLDVIRVIIYFPHNLSIARPPRFPFFSKILILVKALEDTYFHMKEQLVRSIMGKIGLRWDCTTSAFYGIIIEHKIKFEPSFGLKQNHFQIPRRKSIFCIVIGKPNPDVS